MGVAVKSARAMSRNRNRYHGSAEWYTPAAILDRVEAFYEGAYYDPCPASYGGRIEVNGLATSWAGQRVYCNPPYGEPIRAWVDKAMTEQTAELIVLVPSYTETRWFAPLTAHTICFIARRVWFEQADGTGKPAPYGSALVYKGPRVRAFAAAFCELGPIMRPVRLRSGPPSLWT